MMKYLSTFFISMVPVIELRGAIPFGVGMGLDPWAAMVISVIGNMVPIPFIILFIRRIFLWMRKKSPRLEALVERLEARGLAKADRIRKYELIGLYLFVAIPLPGTGAWTGALIAALLDIRLKTAIPMIALGVVTAGFIITFLTYATLSAIG